MLKLSGLVAFTALAVGASPAGAQIYWDGNWPPNADNGEIEGGGGAWDDSAPTWTTADGQTNTPYPSLPASVVFQGQSGYVYTSSPVAVAGMTFLVSGYTIAGEIVLAGPNGETVITVGQGPNDTRTWADLAVELSGTGRLVKDGPGILYLTEPNPSYNATVEVRNGRLQPWYDALGPRPTVIVTGGILDLGYIDDSIASLSGTGGSIWIGERRGLTLDQAVDTTYAGQLVGEGQITHRNSGTLTLTGDSSGFTGETRLWGGGLRVDGLLGGSVNIADGGRLSGVGIVGATTVGAGGRLAPGASIGTLTIDGDLTFLPGSIFEAEVDPTGAASDRVHVRGDVAIGGGAVLHVGADGNYDLRSRYTILTADGGLTGAFDGATSDFAFLNARLSYDYGARTVTLTLQRNDIAFASYATTRNQRATAAAVDGMGLLDTETIYDEVVTLPLRRPEISAAFDMLSGEIHASTRTALIEDSRFLRDAVTGRLRSASHGYGAWAQAYGEWGDVDGRANTAGMDRSVGGLFMGADMPLSDAWRVGLFGGFGQMDVQVPDRASTASGDGYHLGVYAGGEWVRLGVRGGLGYSRHGILTDRAPAFAGFADKLRAKSDFTTLQAFGEVGYRFDVRDVVFEPYAALAHVDVEADDFAEAGGPAALHGSGGETETTFTTLGLRAAGERQVGDVRLTARGSLGWRHALDGVAPGSTQAFSQGEAFTVVGAPVARDAAVIEAGLALALARSVTLGARYDGQLSSDAAQHGFALDLNLRF